jgi:hypothetical protein
LLVWVLSCFVGPAFGGSMPMDVLPGIPFRQSAADPRCVPAACVSVNQSERRESLACMALMGKGLGKTNKSLISVDGDGKFRGVGVELIEVDLIACSTIW